MNWSAKQYMQSVPHARVLHLGGRHTYVDKNHFRIAVCDRQAASVITPCLSCCSASISSSLSQHAACDCESSTKLAHTRDLDPMLKTAALDVLLMCNLQGMRGRAGGEVGGGEEDNLLPMPS